MEGPCPPGPTLGLPYNYKVLIFRMMLVEPHSRSYTRVLVDDLGSPEHPVFASYQSFTPEDYQLECCLDDSHYFIMAPSGVVMGR